jgi:nitroreductase
MHVPANRSVVLISGLLTLLVLGGGTLAVGLHNGWLRTAAADVPSRETVTASTQPTPTANDQGAAARLTEPSPAALTQGAIPNEAAAYRQKQVTGAPAVIVLYSDMADVLAKAEETVHPGMAGRRDEVAKSMRGTWAARTAAERESWGAGQSYIALGYLLLAAQSMGYATSPMLGFDAAQVKRVLDLPEHVTIPALVAIGVADEEGFPHHRHSVDRVATFR